MCVAMRDFHSVGKLHITPLFLMPSFYGGALWLSWLALYLLRLIEWNRPTSYALMVFSFVAVSYTLSTAVFYSAYRSLHVHTLRPRSTATRTPRLQISKPLIGTFHLVGFLGLAMFLHSTAIALGGYAEMLTYLTSEPWRIRAATLAEDMPGVELTYFGWIAIFLTVLWRVQGKVPLVWVAAAAVQFAGNFLFIDRTRPAWIIFVAVMLIIPYGRFASPRKLITLTATVAAGLLGLFVVIARWSGRYASGDMYGDTPLPYWAQGLYSYGTGSFAYFSEVFRGESLAVGLPERTMAPVFKVLSLLGIGPAPPPEVLEFQSVPYEVNVGTFLQPFYQDGGVLYLCVGVVLYSFGWDIVGLLLLRIRDPFAVILWANLCFMTAIAFFVPKVGSTALWLFALMALGSVLWVPMRQLILIEDDGEP